MAFSSRAARRAERHRLKAAEASHSAQLRFEERQREAEASRKARCRTEDLAFFDWDTSYTAEALRGTLRSKYLQDRAYLRDVIFSDEDYRYDRHHVHKFLSPVWDSGQVALNKWLNGFEELRGSGLEWGIR